MIKAAARVAPNCAMDRSLPASNTCQAVMGDADMPWGEQDLKAKFITN